MKYAIAIAILAAGAIGAGYLTADGTRTTPPATPPPVPAPWADNFHWRPCAPGADIAPVESGNPIN